MQSRKPIAKAFKKEVKKLLKEIRRTGSYTMPQAPKKIIFEGRGRMSVEIRTLADGSQALAVTNYGGRCNDGGYRKNTSADMFFDECVAEEHDLNFCTNCHEVYLAYCDWCERQESTPLNNVAFARKLGERFPESSRFRKWTSSTKREYMYIGIRLVGDAVRHIPEGGTECIR